MISEFWTSMSKEEKWSFINNKILNLLSQSDWTQLPDSGLSLSQKIEWLEYRFNLQNLYESEGNPETVIFPEPPPGVRL